MPAFHLTFRDGRPVFTEDGAPISTATYCDCILWDRDAWTARNRDFVESGVHLYYLTPRGNWETLASQFWTDEDVYPAPDPDGALFDLDGEARAILAMDPEARFFVRPGEMIPKVWQQKHPGEMQRASSGAQMNELSYASACWPQFHRYLRNVVAWCEARPWGSRVAGYIFFPHGEGLSELATQGYSFDVSDAMQGAFRAWVAERYPDDAALQAAWRDPAVTRETVAVPTEEAWKAKRAVMLHWPDPEAVARERDYFALQRVLFRRYIRGIMNTLHEATAARPVLLGIDAFKQPMMGWMLNLAFGREDWITDPMSDYPEMTLATGALEVGDLLDDPEWQLVTTPSDYTARGVGFGWESEGVTDSLRLRGKAMFVENDARTWMGAEAETLGAFRTPAEVRAGLLRNTAWALSRGHLHYWMNVGSSYFHDPRIHEASIRDERRIIDASLDWPHRETEHALCFVIDDGSPAHENGTGAYQHLAVLWQRHLGLAHCGVPYRVYLFSDLAKAEMPAYRTYLFPNLFELNADRLALLRATVLREGRVAIFGPATGITDGARLGAEGISTLLDTEFELVRKSVPRRVLVGGSHPMARALAGQVYGDSLPYGPVLVPTRAACDAGGFYALGSAVTFWGINKPGLLLKEFGLGAAGRGPNDYAVLWSVAMPLPAGLLREAARLSGHVWCDTDDVVLASDTIAALHVNTPGPRTLHLPGPRRVTDLLSGDELGTLTALHLEMTAPETRLFRMQ
jgi:hypothetical protein